MDFINFEDLIKYIKEKHKEKIYLVGAGQYGEIIYSVLQNNDIDISAFIDKHKTGIFCNKNIYNYNSMDIEGDCYILTSCIYKEEMKNQILNRGVSADKIAGFSNQDIFYAEIEKNLDYKKHLKKNKKFKDMYKGKRCFVVGNGPSLRIEDLNRIKGEFSIACNSILNLYPMTKWRPTFYFCWDNNYCTYIMKKRESMKKICDNCEYVFTSLGSEGIKYRDDKAFEKLHFIKAMHQYEAEKPYFPLFSSDCSEVLYSGGVAAYPMLQLAAYTGVSEVYLLGMDNLYANVIRDGKKITRDIKNYGDVIQEADKKYYDYLKETQGISIEQEIDIDENVVDRAWQSVKNYYDKNNIKIYNASIGGALEIFQRINLDDII